MMRNDRATAHRMPMILMNGSVTLAEEFQEFRANQLRRQEGHLE